MLRTLSIARRFIHLNRKSLQQICQRASLASASSAKAAKITRVEFDMNRLVKPVAAEITHNQEFIEGEKLQLDAVTEKYSELLTANEWTVSTTKPNSTIVELKTKRGDMEILVSFDAELVAECVNTGLDESGLEEENIEDSEENEFDEDEFEDEEDLGPQPFNFSVQLRRPNALPDKFIEMELEAVPGPKSDADQVYINLIAVRNESIDEMSYAGPQYQSLDQDLTQQFDEWANKNLRHLIPFITDFSRAKEANEYGKWLEDVKTFAKKN